MISSSRGIAKSPVLGFERQRQEGQHVAGVQRARVGGHGGGEVRDADQLDAVLDDDAVEFRALDVAALLDGEVDDHRARLHRRDRLGLDQLRRRPAGDQRRRDHDVGGLAALVDDRRLPRHPRGRHRPRVAADAFGDFLLLGGLVRHVDPLGAERFDLVLDRGPHVGRLDHRAQPLGGRDRLQARDADAHDQHPRRLHRARRGHQHRHEPAVFVGGEHHRLVAGDVRLRRQHVHRLRARDPRQLLEREAGHARLGAGLDRRGVVGIEQADQHGAGLERGELGARPARAP